jgi:DNA-binding MarR family transcriptional regulator
MTKATISDSVKLLLKKSGKKSDSPADTRSYIIELMEEGKHTAESSSNVAFAVEKPLASLSHEQNEALFTGLI